ncbi:hypothetical protein, partial [Flavobacterium sp. ASW18X]|uniref:hypothetical protein n=1 Tax=Flavobacterium sp. ASW18X TaxID=2572595 RepID=UPI0035126646
AAIDEINAAAGTVALVDNGDGTYVFTDASGTTTTISDTSISTLVNNGDGTYTYTDETGTTQTFDFVSNDANNDITVGSDGGLYLNVASVSIAETITNIADNGNGTFTYTNENGVAQTIAKGDLTNNGDGTFTYNNGNGTPITFVGTDDQTATEVAITDAAGNFASTDVEGALAELATNSTDDQALSLAAGNILTLEDGGTVDLTPFLDNTDDQAITAFSLDNATNVLTITLENGGTQTVDLSNLDNAGTDDQTATEVAITDAAGNFTSTDVEGALAELATNSTDDQALSLAAGNILTLEDGGT